MKMATIDIMISEKEIANKVEELAKQIENDYKGEELLVVGILKGASVFVSDLIRKINLDVNIDFMSVSSYGKGMESSGTVRILKDLDVDIAGKNVLIVEDIIDAGTTMNELLKILARRSPAEIRIASLLVKPKNLKVKLEIDYRCFDIENDFIVGYGLDYNQEGRNLKEIYKITD